MPTTRVVESHLSNGVRVLSESRNDFPVVSIAFILDRGTCEGHSTAWLYGGALGSTSFAPRSDNLAYLHFLGVEPQHFAGDDYVAFTATVLTRFVPAALSRLVPVFFEPTLSLEDLRFARDQLVADASRQGVREAAGTERLLRQSLFGASGYRSTWAGARDTAAVSNDDVRDLRRRALSPEHVTVIAVGDFDTNELLTSLEKLAGALPRSGDVRPATCDAGQGAPRGREVRLLDDPRAEQVRIGIGARGVPYGHHDSAALAVLSAAEGIALGSRLDFVLREAEGMTYEVSMRSREMRGAGFLEVATKVESSRAAHGVRGIVAELARASTNAFTSRELERAKMLAAADPGSHDAELRELAHVAIAKQPADSLAARRAAIASVTSEDVMRVAANYLAPEKLSIAVVGDAATLAPQLASLGLGDVVVEK